MTNKLEGILGVDKLEDGDLLVVRLDEETSNSASNISKQIGSLIRSRGKDITAMVLPWGWETNVFNRDKMRQALEQLMAELDEKESTDVES